MGPSIENKDFNTQNFVPRIRFWQRELKIKFIILKLYSWLRCGILRLGPKNFKDMGSLAGKNSTLK